VFSKAVLVGNGLMAIVSALLGNVLVEDLGLGRVAPFDAAIAVLGAGAAIILVGAGWGWVGGWAGRGGLGWGVGVRLGRRRARRVRGWVRRVRGCAAGVGATLPACHGGRRPCAAARVRSPARCPPAAHPPARPNPAAQLTWGENYGDAAHHGGVAQQFRAAAAAICGDRRIALLGAMQSLFEASMYTFVFLWTPALSPRGELARVWVVVVVVCRVVVVAGCGALAVRVGAEGAGRALRRGCGAREAGGAGCAARAGPCC
jgi:hypothetical protein